MNSRDPDAEIIEEIEKRIAEGTEFEGLTRVRARQPKIPRAVFSVRLSPEELNVIARAAAIKGSTVSDFIREVAMSAAEYELGALSDEADLVEVAKSLDVLRARVGAAIKSGAKARSSA